MRPVEVFETSGVAIPGSHYGFHFGQIELSLFRHLTIANSRPSEPFLLLSALAQVSFPAVPATKPAASASSPSSLEQTSDTSAPETMGCWHLLQVTTFRNSTGHL